MASSGFFCQDAVFIRQRPERVFKILLDFENRSRWAGAVVAHFETKNKTPELGDTVQMTTGRWPAVARFRFRLTMIETPRLIQYEFIEGDLRGTCRWTLDEGEEGCHVALEWKGIRPAGMKMRLIMGLTGIFLHRMAARRLLSELKQYAEQEGAARDDNSAD